MTTQKKLKTALRANAAFSATSGIALILFANSIADLMNITNANILLFIGIGLLFFASTVFLAASRKEIRSKEVKGIIIQDWAWVLGSAVLLVLRPFDISLTGNWIIATIALIVAFFALAQRKALAQHTAN